MGAVSQALVDFAKYVRQPAAPGIEVIETPRYRIVLQPDFPIPGPNSVAWVRCRPDEADALIDEVHAQVAPRHVPLMWTLDPETEPADFTDYLEARGIQPDPHGSTAAVSAGMTLFPPAGATINGGAVRAKFRGRGIYRAMVAARLEMAREAGVEGGLAVWGGAMSAPILTRLGFETVDERRFYLDPSTA